MRTGYFAINHTRGPYSTIGSAELRAGFLGEPSAQLTILAGDGEEYDTYWLHADLVERRLEYLYAMPELEPGIQRDAVWPLDDEEIDEGSWQPGEDAPALLYAFSEMAPIADSLAIQPLVLGMDIHQLGGPIDCLSSSGPPAARSGPSTGDLVPHFARRPADITCSGASASPLCAR